jgi:plasmid replication initiation protein
MEFNGYKLNKDKLWPLVLNRNSVQMRFGKRLNNIKKNIRLAFPQQLEHTSTLNTEYQIQLYKILHNFSHK